ncbi:MAG: tyrosine-type recombinase/integrase [Clostridium sp.]
MARGKRSLKSQISYSVSQCFKEKMDKHSIKKEEGKKMSYRIYSYEEKFRLINTGKMLAKFLKENEIEVRLMKDITGSHIQAFLDSKITTCTQNSINTYANSLYKLQEVANKTYELDLKWRKEVKIPGAIRVKSIDRGAASVMKREDYNKIREYAKQHYSQSGQAVRLQEYLGVRVEEIARINIDNIDLENKTVLLTNTKGGKHLLRENLDSEAIKILKETIERNHGKENLFNLNGSSINEYLKRKQEELGLERHSFHDIRRMVAQEYYDKLREKESIDKAAAETSIWLNHGGSRSAMLKECYIQLR